MSEVSAGTPHCFRHPDRETWIRCQRCDRQICPDCMSAAAVGFQCPVCVKEGVRNTRQHEAAYGGRRSGDPRLTSIVLIVLKVLVWVAILATGGDRSPVANTFALIPSQVLAPANGGDLALWQLVTSAFTHLEVWHIALNMIAVYLLGPAVEQFLGRTRFLAVYLFGAIGGSVLVLLFGSMIPVLGASGAVYGLLGALLVVALKRRHDTRQLWTLIGINVAITIFGYGYISWQGHLGGFIAGAAASAAIVWAPRAKRGLWQVVLLGALLLMLLAGTALFLTSGPIL